MLPGGRNSSSSDLARSSRPRSSNRNGPKSRRRKNRKQSSSPTSLLLLDGDDESYNDDENDRLEEHCYSTSACHASSSRPTPIPWTNDLHKEFVNAVFQIGIEESSPAVIAEQMITKNSYNLPQHQHQPASSSSPVLPNIGHDPLSPVAMAAALAIIGGDRDKTARGKPPNHHHHQSKPGRSYENNSSNNNNDLLPEEAEYYKRELTGERLKSHLQKMRKQKVREKQVFLEDYQRCLVRKQALDKEHKEVEKLQKERKEEARNRRRLKLKRKKSQEKPPSTLLDTWQHDSGSDENGMHEDVSKEEEERLLSMYLPLRSSVAIRQNDDNLDLGYDSNHELIFDESINSRNHSYCAFPVGGKAIGMVTFAVQQQEIEDRTKREQKQKQRKVQHQQQQQRQQQQNHLPSCNIWETASVDSWTSHTAIAAGKVATALGPHGRRGAPSDYHRHHHHHPSSSPHEEALGSTIYDGDGNSNSNRQRIVIDCASSEDDHIEHGDGDLEDDDDDQFTASIPILTEAEKSSPLGVSMRLTWDMIKHMHGVIAEDRASKQQQLEQKTKTQQQQQRRRILTKESSSPPVSGAAAELQHLPEQPKLPSTTGFTRTKNYSDRSEAKRIVPPEVVHQPHSGKNNNNSAADAATWNPATTTNTNTNTNSHLLAAIAANGPPPSNLVATALANALLGGNVLGSVELAGAFAPVAATKKGLVTPPHPLALTDLQRLQYEQFRRQQQQGQRQQQQQQQGGYKGSPMPPPMGVLALPSSTYPMGIPQQSRSQTSDAMFRSMLQQQQQHHTQLQLQQQQKRQQQQQHHPV